MYVGYLTCVCSRPNVLLLLYVSFQRVDLLQLMIDAVDSDTAEAYTDAEIAIECLTFLGAGSDTTAVTLTFTTYLLAVNPEAQERLVNEIHDYFEKNAVSGKYQYLCVHVYVCACVCVCLFICVLARHWQSMYEFYHCGVQQM